MEPNDHFQYEGRAIFESKHQFPASQPRSPRNLEEREDFLR